MLEEGGREGGREGGWMEIRKGGKQGREENKRGKGGGG